MFLLEDVEQKRREADKGALCWLAARASGAWDFVDQRQIIRRAAFVWVLYMTGILAMWTMSFAAASARPGGDVAAIIAAVWLPWAGLQTAVFRFYDMAQVAPAGGVEQSATQRAAA